MDLKEKQAIWLKEKPLFEAKFISSHLFSFFNFNENTGDYEIKVESVSNADDEDRKVAYEALNTGWAMWLRAKRDAKAQVAESNALLSASLDAIQKLGSGDFVLVPKDQAKDTARLNFLLSGEKYIRTVTHRDIQNDDYEKIGEHFQLTEVFWIDGFDYWENTSSDSERGAIDKAMIEVGAKS